MEGGGGSSSNSCMMMGFGENSNTLMADANTLFLPLPSNNNNNNHHQITNCYFTENNNNNNNSNGGGDSTEATSLKAKIMSHPHYPRLLAAYLNCQKVGAPPEVVVRLEETCGAEVAAIGRSGIGGCIGEDPALDQFMEAYCEMLTKYEQELSKPFKEAMLFLSRIECQFKALTVASSDSGEN